MQSPDLVPQVAFQGAADPAADRQGKTPDQSSGISKLSAARCGGVEADSDPSWSGARAQFLRGKQTFRSDVLFDPGRTSMPRISAW